MTFSGEAAKSKKQAEKNAAMVAWSSLKQFGSQAGSTSRSSENDEIDEQEQTVIARILAARHTEKQGRVDPRSQAKHVSLNASRTGVLPNWEGSIQSVGDMVVPYNASGWVAVELSGDAVQPQGVITTQQFNNPLRCRPYYPQFASHDGQASVVGCGHSFNILPSNSVISGNVCQLVPVQFGVTHLISQSRQQAPVPVEVHQRDEEWFTNSGSSLSCRPRTIGNSLLGRPTSVNSSYNPTNWIYSAQWLAVHPNSVFITHPHSVRVPVSLPPPVRIRSAVPVSSASPPQSRCEEHQNESTEERTTAGQVINESTEERTTAGQVINEMDSLRLE